MKILPDYILLCINFVLDLIFIYLIGLIVLIWFLLQVHRFSVIMVLLLYHRDLLVSYCLFTVMFLALQSDIITQARYPAIRLQHRQDVWVGAVKLKEYDWIIFFPFPCTHRNTPRLIYTPFSVPAKKDLSFFTAHYCLSASVRSMKRTTSNILKFLCHPFIKSNCLALTS